MTPRPEPAGFDLITIGHVVQERIYFPDRESELVLGSPAAYCGVAAARLGLKVGLVSVIGVDMPERLLESFRQAGVDMEGLKRSGEEQTTTSHLIYDRSGDKIIKYPAKARPITIEDIPDSYKNSRALYICPMDHDVRLEHMAAIGKLGCIMAVDLGGYGGAHSPPRPEGSGLPKDLQEIVSNFNIVKASDEDCRRLACDENADDEAFGRQVLEWGAEIFVSTRGRRGALVLAKNRRIEVAPYHGQVIDPTGGGDTFSAGFLTAWLRTGDAEFAGRYGAATALCVIEKTGGVLASRMPTHSEVELCMRRATGMKRVETATGANKNPQLIDTHG